jgi:serine protease Do
VQVKDIPDAAFAERLGLKEGQSGVVVSLLYDKAPAEKAGLKEGDVILSLDDTVIRDSRGLQTVVATLPLNKPVQLAILREGKPQSLSVTIEEQPSKFGTRP